MGLNWLRTILEGMCAMRNCVYPSCLQRKEMKPNNVSGDEHMSQLHNSAVRGDVDGILTALKGIRDKHDEILYNQWLNYSATGGGSSP